MYKDIISNTDLIRGFFAGHWHSHIYLEILAKNSDGADAVIPQFINTVSANQAGHVMRIIVK